jgi:hypothetical protein
MRKNKTRKNGNGNGKRNGNRRSRITTRQNIQTGSNGLSNQGAIHRPMIVRKFVEAGSDFLGPLTVRSSPNSTADRILLSNSISPSAFPGTRLTQMSNLWERYRFRKFRLRWVPAVPKTIACQLIVYQDTDPLDDPTAIPNADALVRQATAQAGSQQFNFINPMSIDLARRSDDQLYYTGVDKQNERFSRQGNFYVIQVTDPLNFNGEAITSDIMAGSLYVDWVCEFQIAQINPTAVLTNNPPGQFSSPLITTALPIPIGSPATVLGTVTTNGPSFLYLGGLKITLDPNVDPLISVLVNDVQTNTVLRSLVNSISADTTPVSLPAGTHDISITSSTGQNVLNTYTVSAISDQPEFSLQYVPSV